MNRAVFLDRDGVINRKGPSYYVYTIEDFVINEGINEALNYFSAKGFKLIIITNQGGIARGIYTIEQVEEVHQRMRALLLKDGIKLTDVYYCPHHPDIEKCECRKPGTLLFEKAIREHNIDPVSSFMIGDSNIDTEAAEKLGITGILIPTNGNIMDKVIKTGKI
jgi:D-glycero-D-manno-heptose 1,7-bisphosphate phosphatase